MNMEHKSFQFIRQCKHIIVLLALGRGRVQVCPYSMGPRSHSYLPLSTYLSLWFETLFSSSLLWDFFATSLTCIVFFICFSSSFNSSKRMDLESKRQAWVRFAYGDVCIEMLFSCSFEKTYASAVSGLWSGQIVFWQSASLTVIEGPHGRVIIPVDCVVRLNIHCVVRQKLQKGHAF